MSFVLGITGATYSKAQHLSNVDITTRTPGETGVRHRGGSAPQKTVINLSEINRVQRAADSSNQQAVSDSGTCNLNGVSAQAGAAKSEPNDSDVWNRNQHTIFEWALKQFPKGTPDRFGKIAQEVPGKTKVLLHSCILIHVHTYMLV